MPTEIVEIQPPLGGLARFAGHARKPPGYSEDMINCRAFDTLEGRGRIGSRPGLVKAFQSQLGILKSGTAGTTNASPGTTFDDAGVADWTTLKIVAGTDVLEVVSGTGVTAGTYAIASVAAGALTLAISPGASGSAIVYKIGYTPIRLASIIRTFNDSGITGFNDTFPGSAMDAGNWTAGGWTVFGLTSSGLPEVSLGEARLSVTSSPESRAALLTGVTDISTTAQREVSLSGVNQSSNEQTTLYLDLNSASPDETVGIRATADFMGTLPNSARIILYIDGVYTAEKQFSFGSGPNLFRLSVDASNVIKVFWDNPTVPRITHSALSYSPVASPRAGFALYGVAPDIGFNASVDEFALSYISTAGGSPPEAAVFSSNHLLYRESVSGTLTQVTGSAVDIVNATRIYAAPRLEKLYIADYEVRRERLISATAATVDTISATQAKLIDSAIADWTTLGIDVAGDVLEILEATGGGPSTTVLLGVYNIASTAGGFLTFDRADTTRIASACAYRVVRYPKVYDATDNTLTRVGLGTVGTSQFPAGCRSLVLWSDRLVACNDPNTPHVWFMGAAGYPNLWDYGDSGLVGENGLATDIPLLPLDTAAAVPGTQSEFAGLIGEPLVTTIPLNDDVLVFACSTSFYYLTGNPLLNGVLNNITREIGISGIGAWCRTTDGKLIAMTPDGLYDITIQGATPLSRNLLPQELLGLSSDVYDISLAYDVERRGVLISAVSASSPDVYYFWDQRTGGFFPSTHESGHEPTAVTRYQPGGIGIPTILWGCRDGYVRKFDDAAPTDDGTNFTSYCFYGPIRLGGSEYGDGFLHQIVCVLDAVSGNVTLSAQVGYAAQAAKAAIERFSSTMTAGRNRNRWPKLRGGSAYLKVAGTPGSAWAVESITITREPTGRLVVV